MEILRLAPLVLLAACAALGPSDDRSLAERDHRACSDDGYTWPSNAYTGCRWLIQEREHRRQWENMRLMERSSMGREGFPTTETYRPLPRDTFRCVERGTGELDTWIDCRVDHR